MNLPECEFTTQRQTGVARRMALLKMLTGESSQTKLDSSGLYASFFTLDETDRYSITNSIASIGGDLAKGLLIQIVGHDESPLVRHEAAFALGCVGDDSCKEVLKRSLADDLSFLVRHEAAMALGELGNSDDLAALELGLNDESREVSISCEVALNRILERLAPSNSRLAFGESVGR
jgi:HEAT repeat protein